jgi:cyclophilin family peptidyl-prolyl cis-trans isomerase
MIPNGDCGNLLNCGNCPASMVCSTSHVCLPNHPPIVATALGALTVASNASPINIDLAANFTDPDFTNSQVTFNFTYAGMSYTIPTTLFDTTAPQTVANFFDYINSAALNGSIIHRLVSGFVLQGGAFDVDGSGKVLTRINTNGHTVPNEFATSNTQGTIAMAFGSDINGATSQFFFNLLDNSGTPNNLDSKKLTVFGQVAGPASLSALSQLAAAAGGSTHDFSSTVTALANPDVDLKNVPLNGYSGSMWPGDAALANYLLLNSVAVDKRDEFLTYQVSVNITSGPSNVVIAALDNEHLTLSYPSGGTGTATIKVTAFDHHGGSVDQTFAVNVTPGPVSLSQSTVTIDPASIPSGTSATVTLTAKDANGNQLTGGGLSVAFGIGAGAGAGTFSSVTDNGNGIYTATFTGTLIGSNTITANIGGQIVTSTPPSFTVTDQMAGASGRTKS